MFIESERLIGHVGAVSSVKFSSCGDYIASASADRSARIWGFKNQECIQVLQHRKGISDICWNPVSSEYLVTASDDGIIRVFAWAASVEPVKELKGHQLGIFAVVYSARGNLIASCSIDETVRIWNAREGNCLTVINAHSDPITSVDFSPDGTLLASGSTDGLCRIWDTRSGQCLRTLLGDDNPPLSFVKFSPNGQYLLCAYLDSTIRLWLPQERRIVRKFKGHENTRHFIQAEFFLDKGNVLLICGSEENSIFIWDTSTEKIVFKLERLKDIPMSCSSHPNASAFISAGMEHDTSITIWKKSSN